MSTPERFASLSALRSAHADLLRVPNEDPTPSDVGRVADFLRRAAATGVILDTPDDRKQAQGLIDYWAASLQSEYRDACKKFGPDALKIKAGDLVLNEFDAGSCRKLAEAAQEWLDRSPPDLQDVARRVLMRLVTLTADGGEFTPTPVPRSDLAVLGGEETVARVVGDLERLGVIRVEGGGPAGDRIVLASDALTREWPTYAGWLDHRLKFRDASRFWRLKRRPEDLIGGQSVEEAEKFHDKDFVEQEFLIASRRRVANERLAKRWVLAAACLGCIITLSITTSYWFYASRKDRQIVAIMKKGAQRRDLAVRVQREKEATEAELMEAYKQLSLGAVPHDRRAYQAESDQIARQLAGLRRLRAPGRVRPGVSISSVNPRVGAGGSVGCIVKDGAGDRFLLTVNYVLGDIGDHVLRPALIDAVSQAVQPVKVASVTRSDGEAGFALARLEKGIDSSNELPDGGYIREFRRGVEDGTEVVLVGSGSGDRERVGTVQGLNEQGLLIIRPRITSPLDGGSPVLTKADGRLIGLVFQAMIEVGKPPEHDYLVVLPIGKVLDKVPGLTLEHPDPPAR